MDAHGNCVREEAWADSSAHNDRRVSISSDVTLSTTDEDYVTAHNSTQRHSSSSGGGSGLGISAALNNNFSSSWRATAPIMGSISTITAAAAAQGQSNWPGEIMRQTDVRVESRELDQLDAELRRRSRHLPRESRWTVAAEQEAISDLAEFLRNVTPPPSNFMSVPSPSPTTTGNLSSMSSLRKRKSRTKYGTLMKVIGLFKRGSKKKALARAPSRAKKRPISPALVRSPAMKKKRPPRIRLPDTAIAGRTVDGYRHIAISIPIEHAHLEPESHYAYPSPRGRTRSRSMSSADTLSPRVYTDINCSMRPLTAFVTEPHIGTQLGPLVEERESLSSRSWERGSSNGSGQGASEAAIARKVRLASRNTFGTVHEELSRPTTASGMPPPLSPPRSADENAATTSEEIRIRNYRQTLAALHGNGSQTMTPAPTGVPQRPASAHSFRSFATPSPGRVYYPMRKSSLHPSGGAAAGSEYRRPRTMSNTTYGTNYSRDSSRDQTLQESIFSERSYLESLDTVESIGNLKDDSPMVVSEATFARRFDGKDVVEFEPRSSSDSQRKKNRKSESSYMSASSSRGKRTSGSSRASASEKGKQRASLESPIVIVRPQRNSGNSGDSAIASGNDPVVVKPEKRHSGESSSSAIAIFGKRESEPAPVIMTREVAFDDPVPHSEESTDETDGHNAPKAPTSARRSRFVESLEEAPEPSDLVGEVEDNAAAEKKDKENKTESQVQFADTGAGTSASRPSFDAKGKGKETHRVMKDEPPMIEVESATPTKSKLRESLDGSPPRKRRTSNGSINKTNSDRPSDGSLGVPRERSRSTEKRKDERRQKETSPVRKFEKGKRPSTPDGQSREPKDNASPLPSPKDRRELRKSVLLSRKQRVAVLKAALDKPGSQPSDLVWERRLSVSSISSNESTLREAKLNKKRDSFPYAPTILAPIPPPVSTQLSFAKVVTVADVRPSTPEWDLVTKDSIPQSLSSPATVSTLFKTSPVPPFRSLGSVTPPESPTDGAPAYSPSSQFSVVEAPGTALRQRPSTPAQGRITRRRSGRTSPSLSSGRRSPIIAQESSPQRPKTAGKGALASKKAFFEGGPHSPQSDHEGDSGHAGPSTTQRKSILKMTRSEIFDQYEALREKQTHDMERRIRRLERNGDYWLTSMLPILSDMSLTLKMAVGNNGKGKEVDRDRTPTRYDGRQSRFGERSAEVVTSASGRRVRHEEIGRVRSEDTFDLGEPVQQNSREDQAPDRPRLYLHDDANLEPSQSYHVDRPSPFTSEGGRSFSMNNISRMHSSRMVSLAADAKGQHSTSTTMVDSTRTAFGARPSFKRASTTSTAGFRGDFVATEAERIARLERMTERIDAEIRRFPLVSPQTPPSATPKSFVDRGRCYSYNSGRRLRLYSDTSEESLHTYQGTETDLDAMEDHWARQRGGGQEYRSNSSVRRRQRNDSMDTIEPLMRELQVAGSRVSMESPGSEELGDNEVRRMRQTPGPRAVVGFGAFSM